MKKILILCVAIIVSVNIASAQSSEKFYIGPGLGLDYGGLAGIKAEFLPVKNAGLAVGLGYNGVSLGWNVGVDYRFSPEKKVCPNILVMYGTNGALGIKSQSGDIVDNHVSTSVSFGGGLDIKVGTKGNKFSVYLFVPIRSSEFMDVYKPLKDAGRLEKELWPVAFGFGYNFAL